MIRLRVILALSLVALASPALGGDTEEALRERLAVCESKRGEFTKLLGECLSTRADLVQLATELRYQLQESEQKLFDARLRLLACESAR